MTMNDYQVAAMKTAKYAREYGITYCTLGLASEAGEVAGKLKKIIRDDKGVVSDEKRLETMKEIGDVLWYCATLAKELGYTLEEVAHANINKLQSRMERDVIGGSGDNR